MPAATAFLAGALLAVLLGPGQLAPVLAAGWMLALAAPGRRATGLAAGLGLALVGGAVEEVDGRRLHGDERLDLRVRGHVVAVREAEGGRFDLAVTACEPTCRLRRVRLTSYTPLAVVAGERWQFDVRLRAPRALANPGRGDAELTLWRAGIDAQGHVRDVGTAERLAPAPRAGPLRNLRQRLAARVEAAAPEGAGLLRALLLGDRAAVDGPTWRRLAVTGTTHLFVVSGLHVALVAGAALVLLRLCGRPTTGAFTIGAVLLAAAAFAVLSGFEEPVRRALGMLVLVLVARRLGRAVAGPALLARAAALIVMVDPLAVLDLGFWLSCLAVASLVVLAEPGRGGPSLPWRVLRPQLAVSLVLAVPLLGAFGWMPVLGPVVNLLLVPLVGLLVLPAAFLGLGLDLAGAEAGAQLLRALGLGLAGLFERLEPLAVVQPLQPPGAAATVLALGAALAVLVPLPLRVRCLAALALALLLLVPHARPAPGHYRVEILDVGQGLAVLVRTRTRALLFDVGGRFGADADAGGSVIAPALRALGVGHLDLVLLSHGDADHAGGLPGLAEAIPIDVLRGPASIGARDGPCAAPLAWRWDDVDFDVLHPRGAATAGADNRRSCVLRIRGELGRGAVTVVPGDVDRFVERRIAPRVGRTDLMIAPHHGSRTSSGRAWVRHTRPRWVVFAAGATNAFGHPHPEVVARWRDAGACLRTTGRSGMLGWSSDAPDRLAGWRSGRFGWWRWRDPRAEDEVRCGSARDGFLGEAVDHATQLPDEALLVVRGQEVADAHFPAVAAHGDARAVPGVAGATDEEPREQALEDVALFRAADPGLDQQLVVREGQHLLAVRPAHAVPEAGAEDAHLEDAEGQHHPEAVQQEGDADRERDHGDDREEHEVRPPGPGAVGPQHDAPGAAVVVEGDGNHAAGAGRCEGGDASSAAGGGPRPDRPVDLRHGARAGPGRSSIAGTPPRRAR